MFSHLPLAYLDPGTGSLIIQTVLGAVLAGFLIFKNLWFGLFARVRGFFRPETRKASNDDSPR
jgi:hypothetical protein